MIALPQRLSDALRQALVDLEACEGDEKYSVGINYIHAKGDNYTYVGLVGCLLAKSFDTAPEYNFKAKDYPEAIQTKLRAIEVLSFYRIGEAILKWYETYDKKSIGAESEIFDLIKPIGYHENMLVWKENMFTIVRELEKRAL